MADWIPATVVANRHWSNNLFSLTLEANIEPFKAGQFTKLALDIDGKRIQRAYSFVNSPKENQIEVYATRVADGLLSPRLHGLTPGDSVFITARANGFFTLDEIPEGRQLWLFATGTALGPYLSILRDTQVWRRFRKIILIHAVRYSADLSYQGELNALKDRYPDQLIVQPFVSREPVQGALNGRVTHALQDGQLERMVGVTLSPEHSQVMLCGNPEMVKETRMILEEKGLQKNLRRSPGNITMEHYW